jgi:hypothetical protein
VAEKESVAGFTTREAGESETGKRRAKTEVGDHTPHNLHEIVVDPVPWSGVYTKLGK